MKKIIFITGLILSFATNQAFASDKFEFKFNQEGELSAVILKGKNLFIPGKNPGEKGGTYNGSYVSSAHKTALGDIRVIRAMTYYDDDDENKYPLSFITLNNQEIYRGKEERINIQKIFFLNNKMQILAYETCGGSGCRIYDLFFLVVDKNHNPKTINAKNFDTTDGYQDKDGNIPTTLENNQIYMDLGFTKGKKKYAIFENGKIEIFFKKIKNAHLNKDDCVYLYETTKQECTDERVCNDYIKIGEYYGSSTAGNFGYQAISNMPGFNKKTLDKLCLSSCKTKNFIDYQIFAKTVCQVR
ncbi:MAG: hypothetical protein DRQ51_09840 [Gammaproteobacteria bacterium]|nr:MAG: hypothetical protein DRQ51_09840 [Gammaproteobacteria bacterium]